MKKIVLIVLLIAIIAGGLLAWMIFGSGNSFDDSKKYLLVRTGQESEQQVMTSIREANLLDNPSVFAWVAGRMGVWKRLKPGRYEIKKGESIFSLSRKLRNNSQAPVNLTIKKVRTTENLAVLLSKNFEADSTGFMEFMTNADSLSGLGVNDYTLLTLVLPDTYTLFWNTPPGKIFKRLKQARDNFWEKNNRAEKARELGFSPVEVYTIASIVEEETNDNEEKGNIASVYINRYHKGMALGADPTIKYAMKDFTLKRIYLKYLDVESPYNTYRNKGLPPGPICTPSAKTIDAVLNSPRTEYLYFVAKSDFSGHHTFSTTYAEHLQHAREFSKAQDEQAQIRQQNKR